jgi:hypothetical protein
MASFFRHMVSMSKRRYEQDGFDLDLSCSVKQLNLTTRVCIYHCDLCAIVLLG